MNPANYTAISFPFLGLEMNPGRVLEIGPLTIHYYGIAIALGLLLAVLYGMKHSRRAGLTGDDILDGVLWITPLAIVCARIYYCAFSWDQYRSDPVSVLYIWNGGIAIYGAVIGAVIGVIVFSKCKKIKIPALLDLVALGFLIGQCIGRWGNFFNREAFGAETDSFLRMGLLNAYGNLVTYYHPTFLYESVWNLCGFVLLHFASKHRKYDGQIALGYVAWYGLGRAFVEGLRTDSLYWGSVRVSQLLAAVSCFGAVCVLLVMNLKSHDPAKLFVSQVKAAEEAKASEEPEMPEEPEAE